MKYSKVSWIFACAAVSAVLVLLTIGVPVSVDAQSTDLRAIIPFEFHVGDSTLPPGTYTIWRNGTAGAIHLSDGKGHSAISFTDAVLRKSALRASESLVVFNMYGESYFLAEVRWAGYETAQGLPKSRLEIQIAKTLPARDAGQTTVAAQ